MVQVCLSRSPVREGLTSVNALAREVEPLWILWTRWKTPGGRFRARAARVQRGASASTSSAPPTCCRSGSSSRPTRCSNGPSPLRRKRPHVRPGRVRRHRPRRRLARTPSQQFGRLLHPDRRTEPARFGSRGDIRERPSRSSTGSKQLFRAPRRLQPTRPQQPHRERLPVLTSVILHIHARTLGRRLAACDYSRNQSFSDLVEVNDEPADCNQDEYECYLPGDPRQHDGQGMPPWLADRILPR